MRPPTPGLSLTWRLLLAGLLLTTACTSGGRPASGRLPGYDAASDGGSRTAGTSEHDAPDGGGTTIATPVATWPPQGPRPSSFRLCQSEAAGGCDYGEACDSTHYDLLCVSEPCHGPQTGDQRCHRVCDDGACFTGEKCEQRTLVVSDTGTSRRPLCLCAGSDCPVRGPGGIPWPEEGGLATWRRERDMPADLYYHAAAAAPDQLFISGGLHIQELVGSGANLERNAKVFSAAVLPDGHLGEWKESGTLPVPLVHHAMAVLAGRLFVAGGQLESGFSAQVVSAPIREDGTLGPWRDEAPLPRARAWHSLVTRGEELWVLGGTVSPAYFNHGQQTVWRAKASAESGARVSRWDALDAPTTLHYDQGAALLNGRLYAVGASGQLYSTGQGEAPDWRAEAAPPWKGTVNFGASGLHVVRLVGLQDLLLVVLPRGLTLTARLQPDGTVKDWRQGSRLHHVSSGFATATDARGRAYVLGGTSNTRTLQRNPEVWSTSRGNP